MGNKKRILDAWIMVEHLSEGNFKDDKDALKLDTVKDNDYHSFFSRLMKAKRVGKNGGIALYFDLFDFDEVIRFLRNKYRLDETGEDIDKSQKFSFVLCFDRSLNFLQDLTFFTESAYIRYNKDIPENEEEFSSFESGLKIDLVRDFDEASKDPEKFNNAILNAMNKYGISKEKCRVRTKALNLQKSV